MTVGFTLSGLVSGTSAADTPAVKVKIDSLLQLQPQLESTLSYVVSGSTASLVYTIANVGASTVTPSQVAEKLKSFLKAGTSSIKSALSSLGSTIATCCTMSTDVKTMADKASDALKALVSTTNPSSMVAGTSSVRPLLAVLAAIAIGRVKVHEEI